MNRSLNMPVFNAVASHTIAAYQQYISPYKGFRCAYRVSTGRCSCSEYAKIIIRRLGVGALYVAMPRQFARCRLAYTHLQATHAGPRKDKKARDKRDSRCDCSGGDCSSCNSLDVCNVFQDCNGLSGLCESPLSGCDAAPCDCSF